MKGRSDVAVGSGNSRPHERAVPDGSRSPEPPFLSRLPAASCRVRAMTQGQWEGGRRAGLQGVLWKADPKGMGLERPGEGEGVAGELKASTPQAGGTSLGPLTRFKSQLGPFRLGDLHSSEPWVPHC